MAPIRLEEPACSRGSANRFALWALGFRPFYLLAAAFAVFAMLVWLLALSGQLAGHWALPMAPVWWHAHEMLFGFAAAVIVGFLFTASRNWTGQETPTGPPLAGLAFIWLIGRLYMAFDGGVVAALIDSAFLPLAAAAIARVLWRAGSRRNYFLVGILCLLAGANIAFHLARLGILVLDPLMALHFALAVTVVLETTIGGRVIPSFTASALMGVRQWQGQTWNLAAIAITGIALLGWAVLPNVPWLAAISLLAVGLQARRCMGWNPWATRHAPLLWILHLAHLWIPVGLALLAMTQLGWLPRSAGVHALTIGATGGLIIGMITRTALGHTGRSLRVGRVETLAYALVQLAAVVRVLSVAAIPVASIGGIHLAGALWMLAFLLYLGRYGPWLIRPRIDGQPG